MMKVIEKYTKHENINYELFTKLVFNGIEKYDKIFSKKELIIKKIKPKDTEKNISYANLIIKYKIKWIFNENDFKNILDGIDNSNFIKSNKIQYFREIFKNNEIPENTKNKIKFYFNI